MLTVAVWRFRYDFGTVDALRRRCRRVGLLVGVGGLFAVIAEDEKLLVEAMLRPKQVGVVVAVAVAVAVVVAAVLLGFHSE